MPKQNKTKPAAAKIAVVAKPSKKKASKKVESAPVETPVVETPVVETPVVDTPVETSNIVTYEDEFKIIGDQLKSALTIVKDLTVKFNQLEKRVVRDRKVMEKKMRGRVKRVHDPNKPPSGFCQTWSYFG